ncbi:MAG: hypothetical protein VCF25_28810, partial [Candidatus Poribacteria bacterium]
MWIITSICLVTLFISSTFVEGAKLGLAAAWLFEESNGKIVKDTVGGYDGEIKGAPKWAANGKFGRALQFPGKGDSYVRIDHNDVFNSDPYTFMAWTKLKPTTW